MTISKKILIAGLFAISAQFGVFAWSDIAEFKKVIGFAQELHRLGDVEQVKVADWLDAIVNQQDYATHGEKMFILATIDIVSTVDEKVATLQKLIAEREQIKIKQMQEKEANKKQREEDEKKALLERAAFNRQVRMYDSIAMTLGWGGTMFSVLSAMKLFEIISGTKLQGFTV